jgi:hypothetical protein
MEAIQNQTLGDFSRFRAISARQAVLKQSKREKGQLWPKHESVGGGYFERRAVRLTSADVSDR